MTEKRTAKVIMTKAGGNASKNAYTCKVSLPKVWVDQIGASLENRELDLEFDGERIIIKKA